MKVFNFLNGSVRDYCPDGQSDTWGNYNNPDTLKLAALVMHSWAQNGWMPHRYGASFGWTEFQSPILLESVKKGYGYSFWNNWPAIRELFYRENRAFGARNKWLWFTTNDVFNFNFTTAHAALLQVQAEEAGKVMINLERNRLSNAAFGCTIEYALAVIETIIRVDLGQSTPNTEIQLVSDESIARDFLTHLVYCTDLMEIGVSPFYVDSQLLHISRSSLQTIDNEFPFIP